jgi:hypothetical protein
MKKKIETQQSESTPAPESAPVAAETDESAGSAVSVEALVASLGELGEHDLAEAVEVASQGLSHARTVALATFGAATLAAHPTLVLEVYDRISDLLADREEDR